MRSRRAASRTRWQRPLTSRRDRQQAWASLMLSDHGFLRLVYRNRHEVREGVWRSAQPSPSDIASARRAGVRTVISLRAGTFGGDHLEREACEREGIAFRRVIMQSRVAPTRESLREALAVFPTLEKPVLLHCKSGADRAGLGTALWFLIVEGTTAAEARAQLALRFGHFASGRTGILDRFIDAYAETGEAAGLAFAEWVETVYDPEALTAAFKPSKGTDLLLALMRRE
ncbi:MAG: tyrosine-protein phosphatase [Acuticoccus sp.]